MAGFPPPGQPGGGSFGAPPQGSFGVPPQGGYGAPPGGYGAPPHGGYGMPAASPPSGPVPNFVLWMILGFGQVIVCGNILFGVAGGVLALLAKTEWDQGNYESSLGKLKWSKIILIADVVLIALFFILSMVLGLFSAILGASSSGANF
jgi:hypothetical protein